MGHLGPGDIVVYLKGADQSLFATLEDHIKEAFWGDTQKIGIFVQEDTLKVGEDLLTPTNIPYQITNNFDEVYKDVLVAKLVREDMAKLWSTQ